MVNLEKFLIVDTGHSTRNPIKNSCSFNFVSNNSNTLVVTIGDSWTWGSDMTPTDNDQHRLNNHYGQIIATQLDSDWLNLGQGGSGNFWMYDRVRELAQVIPTLNYKSILVVCTLTETGRAIESRRDIDLVSFFKHNAPKDLLQYLNTVCVHNIVSALEPFEHVTLRIGTNFVDYLGPASKHILATSWTELLCYQCNIPYTGPCYVVSPWVIQALEQLPTTHSTEFLTMLVDLTEHALERERLLKSLPVLRNLHPIAVGHRIWAEYILQNI